MAKPKLTVTDDFTDDFKALIDRFKNDMVLVGVPAAEADRESDDPINNATLLAINEFGSPAQNIPARPVMSIGIRNAQDQIAEEFKKCALTSLDKGLSGLITYYERAGLIASNSVKKAINSQEGIKEPADATIASRKSKGFKGTKALIVTGQLRNSITYIVKGKLS